MEDYREMSPSQDLAEGVEIPEVSEFKWKVKWYNVAVMIYFHLAGLYGLYLGTTTANPVTIGFAILLAAVTELGITGGAHRLWAHRTYKAKWPMRLILMILFTILYQHSILIWVRDHRVHHKHVDTDADPHNSRRGFFFSHAGWLMVQKHPSVKEAGKKIDLDDVKNDPIVAWQHRHYGIFGPVMAFLLPALVPWYFWGETLWNSWHIASALRWIISVNVSSLVNSAAHMWGTRPFDESIKPTENVIVSYLTNGEGWHNYHHVFPWDYKAAELGDYYGNGTTAFIDFFAKLGLAYDLKTASPEMIRKRIARTGDSSRF